MNLRVGLIGRQISHSRSPQIFQTIAEITGHTIEFIRHDIEEHEFDESVQQLRDQDYLGCSVTNPYKERVIQNVDSLDSSAARIEAVNSIKAQAGYLTGYNTDKTGFASLLERAQVRRKENVLVLGGGGAARAVVAALLDRDLEVTIACRRREQFDTLCRIFSDHSVHLTHQSFNQEIPTSNFSVVINTTPLGGPNQAEAVCLFSFDTTVGCYFDLNYNHPNGWMAAARAAGWQAYDGSFMLVAQAARSFEIWTGIDVDSSVLYERVFQS